MHHFFTSPIHGTSSTHAVDAGWLMLVRHLLLLLAPSSGSWRNAPPLDHGRIGSDIMLSNVTSSATLRRSLLHNRCPGLYCIQENVLSVETLSNGNGPVQGPFVSTNYSDQNAFPAGIFLAFTLRFDVAVALQSEYFCCVTDLCPCGVPVPITYGDMLSSFRLNFSVGRLCDDLNNLQSCSRESQGADNEVTLGDTSQQAEPAPSESLCVA
jgi:hypothetical protein